jgi:hypothetical protein
MRPIPSPSLTLQLAFGQRAELGDPAFVPGLEAKQASWVSAEGSKQRSSLISDEKTFPPEYYMTPTCVALPVRTIPIRLMCQYRNQV